MTVTEHANRSGRLMAGVIDDPVAHSISPAMQQAALDALGIAADYLAWETPLDRLVERIASLRLPGILGANVTVPHKQAVMPLLDDISPLATRAGAVNTIIPQDGKLLGDNTDVYGFATSLQGATVDARQRAALVLGAGGAARGVVLGLEQAGVASIAIANRGIERAQLLVRELAPRDIRIVAFTEASMQAELARTGLLINATALGWHRGETPIPLAWLAHLPAHALLVDLTYRDTDLIEAAKARGLATLDGLPMLVHQGARALELWTGRTAPVDVMMRAARAARASRE